MPSSDINELNLHKNHLLHQSYFYFFSMKSKVVHILCIVAFMVFQYQLKAQQWGYATLIAPQNSTTVTLLDTASTVIKTWTGLTGQTAYSSYLMPGGYLWRTVKTTNGSFSGGGLAGRVQKVDWNGNIVFDYTVSSTTEISHHDICPMPNGNVLLIVYVKKTAAQMTAAGASSASARQLEKVIELHPTGTTTATIVWQWEVYDHLVQNTNASAANYQSSIVNNPQLLNVNLNVATDWMHMNGIDYNATLDQIAVSSHNLNEIYIIDHSTTTAQAATHSGGNGGKGGDFLYRWGNPANYGATGTKIFNVVHDAHWVPADCPRGGWLGGFNNQGVSNTASAVDLFQPPLSGYNYTLTTGQAYTPSTYGYRHAVNGYSSNMGNSQQLPNGNMLICVATAAKVYEIDANNNQLWVYQGTGSIPQASRYARCYIENPSLATTTATSTICAGATVTLNTSVTATNATGYTYAWSPAAGLSSTTSAAPVANPTATTTYVVTMTTAGGCTATTSMLVNVNAAPSADAGNNVSISSGQSSTLTATGGTSYAWSTGGNTASITVSPIQTTTYTVTVTNANGCTASDQVIVTVTGSTPLSAAATASASTVCSGTSVQLSATAAGGNNNYSYAWTSTPAGFSSTLANPTVNPTANTVYNVVVSDGTSSVNASVTVTVNAAPIANAGNDVTINAGGSTSLAASGGTSYVWSNGATTATITVTPSATTIYTVTATGSNGCTASDQVTVSVTNGGSTLAVSISATDTIICNGDAVQLFANATNGTGTYTYSWTSNPSGFTSTLSNPYVNPTQSTIYTVVVNDGTSTVTTTFVLAVNPLPATPVITMNGSVLTSSSSTNNQWFYYGNPIVGEVGQIFNAVNTGSYQVQVTDANGCSSILSDPVQYNALVAAISATDTIICDGDAIQLFANATGGTGTYTYDWTSTPAGFTSTLPDPYVNPTQSTTYTVVVTDGSTTTTVTFDISVNPLPTTPVISANGGVLTSSSSTGNQWFYYGNPVVGETNQTFTPTLDGSYQVQVTDANGCSSILSDPIAFLDVQSLQSTSWMITPNPTSGQINLIGDLGADFNVLVYDQLGRLLLNEHNSRNLSGENLPCGVYTVKVETDKGWGIKKLVISY